MAEHTASPLLEGFAYTFVTTDQTEYANARLEDVDEAGVWITYKGARVFIAAHELADVT